MRRPTTADRTTARRRVTRPRRERGPRVPSPPDQGPWEWRRARRPADRRRPLALPSPRGPRARRAQRAPPREPHESRNPRRGAARLPRPSPMASVMCEGQRGGRGKQHGGERRGRRTGEAHGDAGIPAEGRTGRAGAPDHPDGRPLRRRCPAPHRVPRGAARGSRCRALRAADRVRHRRRHRPRRRRGPPRRGLLRRRHLSGGPAPRGARHADRPVPHRTRTHRRARWRCRRERRRSVPAGRRGTAVRHRGGARRR